MPRRNVSQSIRVPHSFDVCVSTKLLSQYLQLQNSTHSQRYRTTKVLKQYTARAQNEMYTSSILNCLDSWRSCLDQARGKSQKRSLSKFNSSLWIITNTFIDTTLFMNMGASCLSKNRAFSQNDARGGHFFSFYSSRSTHSVRADIPKSVLGTHIHISCENIVGLHDCCRSLPTEQLYSNTRIPGL